MSRGSSQSFLTRCGRALQTGWLGVAARNHASSFRSACIRYNHIIPNRHQYPPVSAIAVCPNFPRPIFEIEQKSPNLSNPMIFLAPASVPTALAGTLPKASHREYRPKRVPARANVGMERKWPGTLEPAGRPWNSGVQADKSRFQRNGDFVMWRNPKASISTSGPTVSTVWCWTSRPQPGKQRR